MSLSMKQAFLDGGIAPVNSYIMSTIHRFISKDGLSSKIPLLNDADTTSESPFMRQETYYGDSTFREKSSGSSHELENLDTIEDEEFEVEQIEQCGINYAPRTLLEAVDSMLQILDDLGNRYNNWKYGHNGIYRFYCHKYNLANVESSRPYYSRILRQLNNVESISLHLLSTHYKAKSDSAVYSSNLLVDNILCQLDELVSCYCSRNCAFGVLNNAGHVCSDISPNHTNLKWKYPTTSERFLSLNKSHVAERNPLAEKTRTMERNPSLEWSKPSSRSLSFDQNIFHRAISSDTINDFDFQSEKPKFEEALDNFDLGVKESSDYFNESCFMKEMGDDNKSVMFYFSERGIMHNFSQPYRNGEECVPILPFLRAAVCCNCGKFCRCRCQRKIFRKYTPTAESPEHSQSTNSSEADFSNNPDEAMDFIEDESRDFINHVYRVYRGKSIFNGLSNVFKANEAVSSIHRNVHYIHSHSLNTSFGRVQFLTRNFEGSAPPSEQLDDTSVSTASSKDIDQIVTKISKGSKVDLTMGSVYYSNLFKGCSSRVTPKEIFDIINAVPFSCVPVELFNAYKKAEWYEIHSYVWWRLDSRFEDAHVFDDEGNLESYILSVLDALGCLGNLRYDSGMKVIGVGYYRKKHCYWRYFYVKSVWESFRCAVEYFILISTLHSDVHIDHKLACFVANKNGVQKKFSFHPSILNAFYSTVSFMIGSEYPKPHSKGKYVPVDRRNHIKLPFGVDIFDQTRVGNQKCTVADVLEVSLKRKMISSSESSAPRKHHSHKASTSTPSMKLKLDPQLIYQGIFVSTPNGFPNRIVNRGSNSNVSSGVPGRSVSNQPGTFTPNNTYLSGCNPVLPNSKASADIMNNRSVTSEDMYPNKHPKVGASVDNLFDLKLNNLNIILSYYPDVCAQYCNIIKQANELKLRLTLLVSDLKCIIFDPSQSSMDSGLNAFNVQNRDSNNSNAVNNRVDLLKSNPQSPDRVDDAKKRLVNAQNKKNFNKLPMFDVCFNNTTNSWTCYLELMPCLVCPSDCDRRGSCIYYTQGRRLIELMCNKIKPSDIQYTLHPHFNPQTTQNHHDKRCEVSVISFSVNQFGNEKARMLATQLKAAYKMLALNTMLINVSKDRKNDDSSESNNDTFDLGDSLVMKILHNAITSQLTNMISIHSYIVLDGEQTYSESSKINPIHNVKIDNNLNNLGLVRRTMKKIFKSASPKSSDRLDDLINDKVNELYNSKTSEDWSTNDSEVIESCESDGQHEHNSTCNFPSDDSFNESASDSSSTALNASYQSVNDNASRTKQSRGSVKFSENAASSKENNSAECVCFGFGCHVRGRYGDLKLSNVLKFNESLYTFSNIFEMSSLIKFNSKKLQYCARHCCFVTVWKDVMDQTRIMFHPIEKFINIKTFNAHVNKFKTDWPEAVRLHNLHSGSRDVSEGSKMVSKVNDILCECFGNLLNVQKMINNAVVASMSLAIRALTDASQEKSLLSRLFLINEHVMLSKDSMRNSMILSNEILFPFGALHDEATPPISDDDF